MKKFGGLMLIGILILALVLSSCSSNTSSTTTPAAPANQSPTAQATTSQAQTLKIGALLSLSGFFSAIDGTEVKGLQMETNNINQQGGLTIQGQRYNIQLVTQDGQSTLDGYSAATTKLIDDGIKFIIGPGGPFTAAANPACQANKVLHVSTMNTLTPTELDKDTTYAFLGNNGIPSMALSAIQTLKKTYPNVTQVAVVQPDDGSVPYLGPFLQKSLTNAGLQQAGQLVTYDNNTQDFSSIAIKLNGISDAQAYLIPSGTPPQVANIIKQLRQLGNNKPIATSVMASDILPIINSSSLENNIVTIDQIIDAPGNPPLLNSLMKQLQAQKQQYTYLDDSSALYLLTNVIQQSQSIDPTVVKNKWETLDTVPTLYGTGTMGGDQTYGLTHHAVSAPLYFVQINNGQVSPIGWMPAISLP